MQRKKTVRSRLLDINSAADYLGVSVHTLRRMVISGEIPIVKRDIPWARWMFDVNDLENWISKHKNNPGDSKGISNESQTNQT